MQKPLYRRASATGENLTLKNDHIRLEFYKRICGWGWAELWTPDGKMMGVLDHFGELLARDQEIPMRIEGDSYTLTREGDTQILRFPVATTMAQQKLMGTSFEKWVHFPYVETALSGEVVFTLKDSEAVVHMQTKLTSNANLYARYLRGVWLLAGEGSFGTEKNRFHSAGCGMVSGQGMVQRHGLLQRPVGRPPRSSPQQGERSRYGAFSRRLGSGRFVEQ